MSTKTIGTHSGNFHCDESLACFMLQLLPEYKDATITRSRDLAVLAKCDIIVDVGATYDPATHRYDHHQKGFFETFSAEYKTKLSSAGLVYKHFGKAIIQEVSPDSDDKDVELVYQKVYKNFIEALDGIDNGVSQYPEEVAPAYRINTDLSARVGKLNPRWNEEGVDLDDRFQKAMAMAGAEFLESVDYLVKAFLPARVIVQASLDARMEVDASGQILKLAQYTVWKKHLLQIEEEQKISPSIKYVLYEDSSKAWRVQAVPINSSSFTSRLGLMPAWRGVRDDKLSELSGVPGCMFVHASGFIGGAKTYESALKMAQLSLKQDDDTQECKKQKTEA